MVLASEGFRPASREVVFNGVFGGEHRFAVCLSRRECLHVEAGNGLEDLARQRLRHHDERAVHRLPLQILRNGGAHHQQAELLDAQRQVLAQAATLPETIAPGLSPAMARAVEQACQLILQKIGGNVTSFSTGGFWATAEGVL